jgi:hypothetical protein
MSYVGNPVVRRPGASPAFYIYLNGAMNAASGPVKVGNMNGVVLDTDAACSNGRFMPKVPGIYHISFAIQSDAQGNFRGVATTATAQIAWGSSAGDATVASSGSGLVHLNGIDEYVELWASFPTTGGNLTPGKGITFMCGHLVRAD